MARVFSISPRVQYIRIVFRTQKEIIVLDGTKYTAWWWGLKATLLHPTLTITHAIVSAASPCGPGVVADLDAAATGVVFKFLELVRVCQGSAESSRDLDHHVGATVTVHYRSPVLILCSSLCTVPSLRLLSISRPKIYGTVIPEACSAQSVGRTDRRERIWPVSFRVRSA